MAKKTLLLAALFIASITLTSVPGVSLAQAADNTKINQRDRSRGEMTADQQGQSKQDREITQKIRKAIREDKSLSTYAHNVKIITADGMVTLKGPVRSEAEKAAIEQKAARITGNGKINNELDIALARK